MGSLTKSVKAPTPVVQTVYVPSSSSGSETTPASSSPAVPVETDEQVQSRSRTENLLRRARGTLGTVLTGFRGILGLNDNASPRKNLLGE